MCVFIVVAVSMSNAARINKAKRDTSDESPPCNMACPFIYQPVCGWNGVEYKSFGNSCLMKSNNCAIEGNGQSKYIVMLYAFLPY